jgi:hypothetical protein
MKNPKKQDAASRPSRRITWPVIESAKATAAILGAPLALVKAVKQTPEGARAFLPGNRVDTGILIPVLFAALTKKSDMPDGCETPQDWLATEKAKREQIKRQREEGETMATADARRQAADAWGWLFSELERMERESPPAWSGLSSVELGKRIKAQVEKLRAGAKAKFEEVGE